MIKDREKIKEYLDACIRFWRKNRDDLGQKEFEERKCICYIDAFQSVRYSIFEELLS